MQETRLDPDEDDVVVPENRQGEKRKRATEEINFASIQNDEAPQEIPEKEDEAEEPAIKKSKIEPKPFMPESNLPLFPAQCCLHTLMTYWPEEAKSVLGDRAPQDITDVKEANDMISKIRYIKGIKTGTQINNWFAGVGLSVVEDLVCEFTPLNIKGFSNAQYDPEFQSLWQEICIDYMTFQFVDPKVRMGMYLLKNAYLLNHLNNEKNSNSQKVVEVESSKE